MIASVRTALAARGGQPPGEIELRVAASVAHLGLVARLVAPALGAAVTGHRVDMRLDVLWWQDTLGGPVPLSIPVAGPLAESAGGGARDSAEVLPRRFLDEVIAPVTRATRELVPMSSRVLWGNVAAGNAVSLSPEDRDAARADLRYWRAAAVVLPPGDNAEQLRQVTTDLLGFPPVWVGRVWLWDVRPIVD